MTLRQYLYSIFCCLTTSLENDLVINMTNDKKEKKKNKKNSV